MTLQKRAYTTGHFQLDIDGHATTSYLKSVDGGHETGHHVEERVGNAEHGINHLSTKDIEPLSLELGVAGSHDLLSWIQKSWQKKPQFRNGQITHANFDLFPTYEHEFFGALITETTFPALDGASKDPAYLKMKLQPSAIDERKVSGSSRLQGSKPNPKQKMWSPSNFRFAIDDIDEMVYTNKIESFTVKQDIKKHWTGEDAFPEVRPVRIKFPTLTFTIALEYADKLLLWKKQCLHTGLRDTKAQKSGSIEFLAPNLDDKKPLFQINLYEMSLKTCHVLQSTANGDPVKRVKGELYVGRMDIDGRFGFD